MIDYVRQNRNQVTGAPRTEAERVAAQQVNAQQGGSADWPKWVEVDDSHVMKYGDEDQHHGVHGFSEFHRDRTTGKFSVLVNNPDEEKRATAAKAADDGAKKKDAQKVESDKHARKHAAPKSK